jgi:phosphohistidine phosphatase
MTDPPTRRLVVVRHSKTEPYATTDHARTLTDRGRDDARALGRWMVEQGIAVEVLLVSSAARAVQTADLIVDEFGADAPDVMVMDDLYDAGAEEAIALCRESLPESALCAAVVGHNPTMASLADELAEPSHDEDLGHFPTSAAAVLDIDGGWADLEEGAARLVTVFRPKER